MLQRTCRRVASCGLIALIAITGCDLSSSNNTSNAGSAGSVTVGLVPVARAAPTGPAGTGIPNAAAKPDAAPRAAGAEVALFNGKDLSGWVVTECETEVKDGVLLLKAGEGWIRSNDKYADFVLSWECKNLKPADYDSGVHFRAELPAPKAHWPKKFQVNLKTGLEGNLTSIKSAASTGLYKNGEWNAFKLTVVGSTAELEINGKPAWKTDGIDTPEGYIGLQSEVTLGGQFEFKNIKLKRLTTP